MTETARDIWGRKLAHLQLEEAKAADAEQKFAIGERIREVKAKLAELDPPTQPDALRIDLTHLPKGADHFLGRGPELAWLDEAWGDSANTHIVELTAPGGVGKTALVKRWLDGLRGDGWGGAERIYAWSFYSQGTGNDRQASEDGFLAAALEWFGVAYDPALGPADKGRLLAQGVAAGHSLLVLDGIEPLQYPPGPLAGELRAPGLKTLLGHLATAGHPGLVLLTSRERITDLKEYQQGPDHPTGGLRRRDPGNLGRSDGARLLFELGANRAGAAAITPDDRSLKKASAEVQGHALTLALLGTYLALSQGGDILRRDQVKFQEADAEIQGGHAFRVMGAYETWFLREGKKGARELAALRLLGCFDRPAAPESLEALRTSPAIPGLTEPLVGLSPAKWRICLKRLEECRLVYPAKEGEALDAHPLVREYLAEVLQERNPEAWKEGHRRIYEQLKESVPQRPDGLPGLQPLYQAVAHGCKAGLYQEACADVYEDRILRGTGGDGFYSWKKLGAFGANLGALYYLFAEPWRKPAPALSESDQAWLLNETAIQLHALGRLDEALEPMEAGAEMRVEQKNWKNAAITYSNLSELQLTLGRVAGAGVSAGRSLDYAERSGDASWRMVSRTTLADALHQQGETQTAGDRFTEAEAMQAERQPQYPLLYSLQGFQYCDLLLAGAERAAWGGPEDRADLLRRCGEVAERAQTIFEWRKRPTWNHACDPDLDVALDQLTLARCALYTALLQDEPPETARADTDRALDGLRASGEQEFIAHGLLTRAWLRHHLGDPPGAGADLDEAQRIAERGSMRLHLADCHLTRARLFRDPSELARARGLIEEWGYGRRLGELEDTEAAAKDWPEPSGS